MSHSLIRPLVFVWLFCSGIAAYAGEGISLANKLEGEHFTVEYDADVNLSTLLEQLRISSTDLQLTHMAVNPSSLELQLLSSLEVLFARAGDVLDMHVYSYKGSIKVFARHEQLEAYFRDLYHTKLPCTGFSFYIPEHDTIYISADHFSRDVLGHEMGHAIMTHYFVVQPSIKVQEVLAGYVEYQLKKSQ